MTSHQRCPCCRGPLTSIDVDAQTPPWLCRQCARAWWNAELEAAEFFDPETRDFGTETVMVVAAAEDELAASLSGESE